ncbi:C6 transcription factor [Neofusicoccum parvum]|nr:C6 transcription factor [Neofusicoccum parvum]
MAHNPYGSRRSHRKSRNGCKNCKQRKIKCDEAKPQCWPCTKHDIKCDFSTAAASPSPRSPASASAATSTPPHRPPSSSPNPSTSAPTSSTTSPPTPPTPTTALPLPLNLPDLHLLHHFTIHTAPTLSPYSPELRRWWTHAVPTLAFAHPPVMRSLLALSALHVARTSPATRSLHLSRAAAQQGAALREGRALLAGGVDAGNCAALYVFGVLTVLISLARGWGGGDAAGMLFFDGEETGRVAEWVRLLRGIKAVVDPWRAWMVADGGVAGDIGAAMREGMRPGRLWEGWRWEKGGGEGEGRVAELRPPLANLGEFIGRDWVYSVEEEERRICLQALEQLNQVFSAFLEHGEDILTVRLIFSWSCQVEHEFLVQLSQHRPHALLVFSYFGVLLHWIDKTWWLEGWGTHLVHGIAAMIDARYHEWLQWPLQQIKQS